MIRESIRTVHNRHVWTHPYERDVKTGKYATMRQVRIVAGQQIEQDIPYVDYSKAVCTSCGRTYHDCTHSVQRGSCNG